jgi:alkaline phosphatase D
MTDGRLLSRRALLRAGIGGLAWTALPAFTTRTRASPVFKHYPFSLGVASGEPTADGIVLWTRIAPEPLAGGGLPMLTIAVQWQIAADERMQHIVQTGTALAHPELAHAVHVEVAGLLPARDYWYRFISGGETSPVARTRTLPAPAGRVDRLRFGVAGCQRYEEGYFTAYRHLAGEHLDLVFHYGDYIYEYKMMQQAAVRRADLDESYTVEDYRKRYALYKLDDDLQAAHASAPFLVSWDDHEVDNNWAGDRDQDSTDPALFLLRRAAAFQAFYEHMPLRRSALPRGPDMLNYRRFNVGNLAQINVLDTRQFRSDQPCGDGSKAACSAALAAGRTMLGRQQEQWLYDGLSGSPATWHVLAQQVMMVQLDRNTDAQILAPDMDTWNGAVAARQRLFDVLQRQRVRNPVVLSGDIHSHWAGQLKADFTDEKSAVVGTEFVATSISSGGDGSDQHDETPQVLAQNPHMKFFNNQRGYLSIEVTPQRWQTHFRTLDYVTRRGAPLGTRATYVLENGALNLETS